MLNRLRITYRMIILAIIVISALAVNAGFSWLALNDVSQDFKQLYQGSMGEIAELREIKNLFQYDVIDTIHKIDYGLIPLEKGESNIKNSLTNIEIAWKKYLQQIHERSGAVSPILKNLETDLNQKIEEAKVKVNQLTDLILKNNKEALPASISSQLYHMLDPIKIKIDRLIVWHTDNTIDNYQRASASLERVKKMKAIIFSLTFILIFSGFYFIARSITKPLVVAIEAIKKVAQGDLTTKIQYIPGSKSEEHQLLEAIHQMIEAEQTIAEALATLTKGNLNLVIRPRSINDVLGLALVNITKKLRSMIESMRKDVQSLTNSSKEIIDTVSRVAISSSESATAVSETTITVEELKQTAQIATQKAQDVLRNSKESLEIVQSCEKSLKSTLEDMRHIYNKMRSISEGIIKLSEFSQTIGEIIDSVNDLAEQSNLLAVNAAIEAAKAGDQGKGFGVIALEIRTLAEQSKTATIQVKGILNDIQNATNAAVLATEQGAKAVDKGMSRSSETSDFMHKLVESVAYVSQSTNQIVLSSEQQLLGVDQVNIAMTNINDAAKQHIENMRTIENTVIAFNAIGQTLKEITGQYVMNDTRKQEIDF